MKKSRYSESQIIKILKEVEGGHPDGTRLRAWRRDYKGFELLKEAVVPRSVG